LEGFGGVAGVMKVKLKCIGISLNDKFVFVNLEDAIQIEKTNLKSCSFGVNRDDADVSITSVKTNPFVEVHYSILQFHLIGLGNLYAAITIGKYFEVDENSMRLRVIFQKIIGHNY
jgi:UDP-N-acetylmuramoyl-tripeptide--D-alanyl-D-alanine ligase